MSIASLLQTSLTGDQAITESVPSLVVRVENIYVRGGEYFAVDARADWASFPIELTVREAPDEHPRYDVAGFVAHISDPTVEPRRRMRSGHYTAYVKFEDVWFELDDSRVTALSAPPARFPYLVFLVRRDPRRRLRSKQTRGTTDQMMLELLRLRSAACTEALANAAVEGPAMKRARWA